MNPLWMEPLPFLLLLTLLGAIMGSFLSMLVHRLPRMMQQEWHNECQQLLFQQQNRSPATENLAFPNSYCPHCHHPLRWRDNLPLLGYLINRGRCYHCHHPIHWRYFAIELLATLVAFTAALHFGPTTAAVLSAAVGWVLLALLFIDLEHQLLPDSLTLPLLWGGLIANQFSLFASPSSALWGAIAGYLSLWTIFHLYRLFTGKIGMGHGDFKLFAALGAWCGWQLLPQILLFASVIGILAALPLLWKRQVTLTSAIPFGPFLALGGWLSLMFGNLMQPLLLMRISG